MHSFDREKLLSAVLEDEGYRVFREQTFRATRRQFRAAYRKTSVIGWLAVAAGLMVLAALWRAPRRVEVEPAAVASSEITPQNFAVESRPLQLTGVVRSVANKRVIVETAAVETRYVRIVHTRPSYLPEINDAQLLAMFARKPAGIMTGPAGKEFVLFEPKN